MQGCARALSARCGGPFVAVEYDVPYVMHMFPIILYVLEYFAASPCCTLIAPVVVIAD